VRPQFATFLFFWPGPSQTTTCLPLREQQRFSAQRRRRHLVTGLSALAWQERKLPFLAIETDGNPFPQLIEARMEAFCLQAQRLNEQMLACGSQGH
jgi:hypothetical protein